MHNTTLSGDVIKAHLALLGTNLLYGAGFTIAKTIMPRLIEPKGFILIRVSVTALLFCIPFFGKNPFREQIDQKDLGRIILCALFGVALNQLFFFEGLSRTTPIHAALMMLTTPILVSFIALWMLKEKMTGYKMMGLILGISGAVILSLLRSTSSYAPNPLLGDLFVFINAVSYALYLVLVKPLMAKYRPIVVIRYIFLFGFLFVLPFGSGELCRIPWTTFQSTDYFALAYIVIGITYFTYLWNIYALRILSPTTAGAYIYSQPVFSAIIAIFVFQEALTPLKILAAIFIFSGVYLVSFKKKNL